MATKMKMGMGGSSMKPMMEKGGIRSGVKDVKTGVKKINKGIVDKAKPFVKRAIMATPPGALYMAGKAGAKACKTVVKNFEKAGKKGAKVLKYRMKALDDKLEKRYPNYTGKGSVYSKVKSKVKSLFGFQKGGTKK